MVRAMVRGPVRDLASIAAWDGSISCVDGFAIRWCAYDRRTASDGAIPINPASKASPHAVRKQICHFGAILDAVSMERTRAFKCSDDAAKSIPQVFELCRFKRAKRTRDSA